MGSYEKTRKQIEEEMVNDDLKTASIELADMIERMSNISSNTPNARGLKSYDVPELKIMLDRARKILFREVA